MSQAFQRLLLLLSGGIDSPVAATLLNDKGMNVDYIHFTTDIDKTGTVRQIVNKLKLMYPDGSHKLWIINFDSLQKLIVSKCREQYRTLLYKVMMVRIACTVTKSSYIATGNSLGQVASQTLSNIINTRTMSPLYIISPLMVCNKDEIIEISKEKHLFDLSTASGTEDCCTMYLPKKPILTSKLDYIKSFIASLDECIYDMSITCI